MCLHPIYIRNPTRKLSQSGGQLLKMKVCCNKCAECLSSKVNEWHFRAYHHTHDLIHRGGYVYYATLTYAPKHLPMLSHFCDIQKYGISDFSCFNHSHFRGFLKRLRSYLKYHYHYADFTYFLTSEYGVDDRYTHRPHYHVLFYIDTTNVDIPPLKFSNAVEECWQYGITDGIKHKPLEYVAKHVYGRDLGFGKNTAPFIVTAVCMYVSKYITKSSEFQSRLDMRIKELRSKGMPEEEVKQLIHNISMFHRQSQGFGITYLDNMSDKEKFMLSSNECIMPDKDKVVKSLPLPMYFRRKLYYNLLRREDKTYYWQLRDDALDYAEKSKIIAFDKSVTKFNELLSNISKDAQRNISNYLRGRSIEDYCIYQTFYKGRLRDMSYVDKLKGVASYGLTDNEYNLYDWQNKCNDSYFVNDFSDSDLFHYDVDNGKVYLPKKNTENNLFTFDKRNFVEWDFKSFCNAFTFNQGSCPEFMHFDDLERYIDKLTKKQKEARQRTYEYEQELKKRLKQINYVTE